MTSAAVTVAISTLDRAISLGRCLDSIWAGAVRPSEVVIVDQGADRATDEVLADRRARGVPLVHLRQSRRGLGASQNLAFARARMDVVAVIDDDCVADDQWLATMEETLRATPALEGVAGRVLPQAAVGERAYPVASRTSALPRDFHGFGVPWEVGSGNNFALRRAAFDGVGGCDERLGPGSAAQGGVDMDLFYRLLRAGARLRYEPRAVVFHERQSASGRRARRPMYGRGMGAAIAFALAARDPLATRLLGKWVALRVNLMGQSARRADWPGAREEWVMLLATARGLAHGFAVRSVPRRGPPDTAGAHDVTDAPG